MTYRRKQCDAAAPRSARHTVAMLTRGTLELIDPNAHPRDDRHFEHHSTGTGTVLLHYFSHLSESNVKMLNVSLWLTVKKATNLKKEL